MEVLDCRMSKVKVHLESVLQCNTCIHGKVCKYRDELVDLRAAIQRVLEGSSVFEREHMNNFVILTRCVHHKSSNVYNTVHVQGGRLPCFVPKEDG